MLRPYAAYGLSKVLFFDNKSEDVEAILLYSVFEILVRLDLVWPHSYLLT